MQHTVITTTSSRSSGDGIVNVGYTRTIPGLLKLGQIVALFITVLCVRCARGWPNWAAFQFFEVVTLWFLGVFLIFFLMHLFKLHAKMSCINWPLTENKMFLFYSKKNLNITITGDFGRPVFTHEEFFHYAVGALLVFIASVVAAVKSGAVSALVTASVFGFMATFLMAVSLWTSYSVACGSPQTV